MKTKTRPVDVAMALAVVVALVLAWQLWVWWRDVPLYRLPGPADIGRAFWDIRDTLPAHIRATVTTAVLGLVAGAALGVALAVPITAIPAVRRVVYPLLVVSQSIPLVVLAPALIVWLGFGTAPRVVVVALITFFPVAVSTVEGIDQTDREVLDLVRAMGGRRSELLRRVQIPSALPSFFAGLSVAASYAMLGAVIAEGMGASEGLGLLIARTQTSFRPDRTWVGIAFIALVSVLLFIAVRLIARLATPWLAVEKGTTP